MTSPPPLQIEIVEPTSAVAMSLIRELSAELAGMYDYASDGSGDFRPEETLPNSTFLVGRFDGEAVACGAIRPLETKVAELKRMYVNPKCLKRRLSAKSMTAINCDGSRQSKEIAYPNSLQDSTWLADYRRIRVVAR